MMPPRGGEPRAEVAGDAGADLPRDVRRAETGRLLDAAAAELNGAGRLRRRPADRRRSGAAGRRPGGSRPSSRPSSRAPPPIGQEAWVSGPRDVGLRARSPRTWSATSSSPAATSTATRTTASSAPTTCCSTTIEPQMTTAEVAALFDRAQGGAGAADRASCARRRRSTTRPLHGPLPDRTSSALVARDRGADGFRSSTAGGSTTRSIRSRPASAPATCGSRPDGTRPTSRWRCSGRCTSAGMGCTRRGSPAELHRTPLGTAESLGDARIPEPAVGEHGRPRPAVLRRPRARGSAELSGGELPGSTRTRCTARSTASARRSSGSRPTRRPTACTSCCGSSSSRS